jgi:hypothetical protein
VNIIEAIEDPQLFALAMERGADWGAWKAYLKALFGIPLSEAELALWRQCTGRTDEPAPDGYDEAALIVGRRGRKSFIEALTGTYLACFHDFSRWLAPGERGVVLVIAPDRRQTRTIMRYIRSLLHGSPLLQSMIERETADVIDLVNGISIEVGTSSYRSVRGYAIVSVLVDEVAFLPTDDSADPDFALLDALRPAMATIPIAKLIIGSSPYAKRGALYAAYRDYWGKKDAPALVWQADTLTMNPGVPEAVIKAAYERDPASAAAEWGAQFRDDVAAFISREIVEACIVPDREDLPALQGVDYFGGCDPSGGARDSMCLSICHLEDSRVIVDVMRECKPPFSPDDVCREFAELARAYRVDTVRGDRYAGRWPAERFAAHGVRYEVADHTTSDLFRDLLPVLMGARIELPDNPRLTGQICALERRTARSGKDQIGHPPGGHDDLVAALANAVAQALPTAAMEGAGVIQFYKREAQRFADNPFPPPEPAFGFGLKPAVEADEVLVEAPPGCSSFYDSLGRSYTVGVDRIIAVPRSETPPLRAAGWRIVELEGHQI